MISQCNKSSIRALRSESLQPHNVKCWLTPNPCWWVKFSLLICCAGRVEFLGFFNRSFSIMFVLLKLYAGSSITSRGQPRDSQILCHPLADPVGLGPCVFAWSRLSLACHVQHQILTPFSAVCIQLKAECLFSSKRVLVILSLPRKVLEQIIIEEGMQQPKQDVGLLQLEPGKASFSVSPSLGHLYHISAVLDCHVASPKSEVQWNPSCSCSPSHCPASSSSGGWPCCQGAMSNVGAIRQEYLPAPTCPLPSQTLLFSSM